jgi:hypothetical protein
MPPEKTRRLNAWTQQLPPQLTSQPQHKLLLLVRLPLQL